ncbi:MAG: IS1634 family transposase [Erysipelotrichales bacterium]|nr:IS1634 family transposase [Erysipelotrichales bacterium]
MFIKLVPIKSKNDKLVYLAHGYRDSNNKVKHRLIKLYGYLGELEASEPNVLERLRREAKKISNDNIEVTLKVSTAQIKKRGNKKKFNYGYSFLEAIYNSLTIPKFIDFYSENKRFKYNLDDILKLLVFSRCLNPSSKRESFNQRGNYFFELEDFSLDNVYESLSNMSEMKDGLMVHLNKELVKQGLRDVSLVFYDVTNYYFESEALSELKQRGVSKENRKTAIIQMGLFIDNNGIPITYELFSGNTNDLSTMRPILEKVKKDYNLGKITIVGDKGNNSSSNLKMIKDYGDDYIIAQRIRNRGNKYSDIVLDQSGYIESQDKSFRYKLVAFDKEIELSDGSIEVIKEHLMCFWSKDEEAYQKNKRGLLDEKIEKFINEPSKLKASNSFGIKKYFKQVKVDKGGEILKGKDTFVFNQKKYERDIALDGYYTIVTNNLDLSPMEIVKYYRQLSRIEESFKITKSDLEGRPIYVWTDEHIKGHFLTCYLSLLIYRILQIKLENKYPVHKIKAALNSAELVSDSSGICTIIDQDLIFDEICKKFEVDYLRDYMSVEQIKQNIKKTIQS